MILDSECFRSSENGLGRLPDEFWRLCKVFGNLRSLGSVLKVLMIFSRGEKGDKQRNLKLIDLHAYAWRHTKIKFTRASHSPCFQGIIPSKPWHP